MASQIMNPLRLSRLCSLGFAKMRSFRKARLNLLSQYVGRFYGKQFTAATGYAMPIGMIHQATTTIVPNLVYQNPKADITSRFLAYREYADVAEMGLNHLTEEINLRMTLRKVITDAVFMAGFTKSGLAVSGQTLDIEGFLQDIGQPYSERVDPDDMVLDPVARQWEEQRFIGNRFRVDLETLLASGLYDETAIKMLASRYDQTTQNEASSLGGDFRQADDYVKAVDLVELWIPSEDVIVTLPWLPGEQVADKFLRVVDYEGPEKGPYDMLGFAFVPDNILPVAPAAVWYDLHIMVNKIARKVANQAERQKQILAFESSAWQDAQEVVDAADGETVRVDNIDALKEIGLGGVPDQSYKYLDWAKTQFSEMAMNIDLLSGAGTDEPTASQAEMVQANATVRLEDMRQLVYQFTADVMKQMFFFLHTDPLIELPLVKRTEGVDSQVHYTPEMREGDWLDYNIKVKPYSMARQDPNIKVRRLLELFGNVIPAMGQAYQVLGPAFNFEGALNVIGRNMGIEELDECINSEALHMQLRRMQELLEAGVPVDTKVYRTIMSANTEPGAEGGETGSRPEQPNPRAALPGGIEPRNERNAARQDTAAELQAALT